MVMLMVMLMDLLKLMGTKTQTAIVMDLLMVIMTHLATMMDLH